MKEAIIKSILADINYVDNMIGFGSNPGEHQFVMTAAICGPHPIESRIGYCVQVRKKCGAFGSDKVFLRHPNGNLIVHENQSFIAMTEEQEEQARTIFEMLPDEETPDDGYSDESGITETGFLIEASQSQPMQNMPVIQMTVDKGSEKELIAFI